MWGNASGWKISAVILLVGVGGALWLQRQMQITAPTSLSLDPANMEELSPPALAQSLVDLNQAGDAGKPYRAAIAAYDDAADDCESFSHNPDGVAPEPMRLVLEATHLAGMNLFAKDPKEIIDYQTDHPALDNLTKVAGEMDVAGWVLAHSRKNVKEGRPYFQAVYALGFNLCRERVDFDEFAQGMGLMDGAARELAECEPAKSAGRDEFEAIEPAMVAYLNQRVLPIDKVLTSADQTVIAANAGDVFRFAAHCRERMFRVEAILKLGRYRFDAGRMADQLAAPRYIRTFAHDPDPVIQAAADAAAALTIEQYRMIH